LALSVGGRIATPVVISLLAGVLLANSRLGRIADFAPVSTFLSGRVLKVAIVCLGAGVHLELLKDMGLSAMVGGVIGTGVGLGISVSVGRALLLPRRPSVLIGIGTAICGATAIMAAAPLLKAKDREVALALGVIFVFNAVALLVLPPMGLALGLGDATLGLWAGLGIHDASAAISAGFAVSPEAGQIATVVKMFRTLLLIPLILAVGLMTRRGDRERWGKVKIRVPGFILGFIALSLLTSVGLLGTAGTMIAAIGRVAIVFVVAGIGAGMEWHRFGIKDRRLVWTGMGASLAVWAAALCSALLLT
jgi:uncharacterized integral membrane protein (TIGR00698 family)